MPFTQAERKRRWRAKKRGEYVPPAPSWKGTYKWPEARKAKWRGEGNPNWSGDAVSLHSARGRALRWFTLGPCEVCGSEHTERHHKDGNTLNNSPSNIAILCRKHHMEADGRLERLRQRIIKQNLTDNPKWRDLRNATRIPASTTDVNRLCSPSEAKS